MRVSLLLALQGSSSVLAVGAKQQHQHKEEQGQKKKVSPMGNEEMHIAVPQGKEALAPAACDRGPWTWSEEHLHCRRTVFSAPFCRASSNSPFAALPSRPMLMEKLVRLLLPFCRIWDFSCQWERGRP